MVEAYPVSPDRIKRTGRKYDIMVSKPATAREFRRARNTTGNPKHIFTLYYDYISFDDKETLLNFFEQRKGRWEAFEWTQPASPVGDGQTYTVRFDQDTLSLKKPLGYNAYPRYQIEIKLVEVL